MRMTNIAWQSTTYLLGFIIVKQETESEDEIFLARSFTYFLTFSYYLDMEQTVRIIFPCTIGKSSLYYVGSVLRECVL